MSINAESMPTHNSEPEDPLETLFNAPAITDEERLEATFSAPAITDEERFGTQAGQETASNNNEVANVENPTEAPAAGIDIYTKTAVALALGTERISAILSKLSEGVEARQDNREKAKATISKFGKQALKSAKNGGLVVLGVSVLAVKAGTAFDAKVSNKIFAVAAEARKRYDERAAYREDSRRTVENQNDAFASYEPNVQYSEDHAEADEMNRQKKADQEYADMSYGPNIRFSQDHIEANAMNEQKKSDQEYAYNSYSNNIDTTRRRERQEDAYDSYEDNIEYSEILERRRLAQERKAARRARNQERFNTVRAKGSEVLAKAKGFAGRLGRSALKTFHRGRAAVSAAVSAGVETWRQTAA